MPVVPSLDTQSYLNYEELSAYLQSIAAAVPQLARVFSLGNSLGGRALWVVEVTNTNTGAPSSKPAIWLDGSIHGGQFSTSSACLAILQRLAAEHGRNPLITELLDNNTFYIAPRLAPDGAELALASGLVTSAGRRLGFVDGVREGLVPGDINGDGRILQMRIADPYGQWKASGRDNRLMTPREPGDLEGKFYRLYREGLLDRDCRGPLRLRLTDSKRALSNDFTAEGVESSHHYGESGYSGPFSQVESRLVSLFLHSLSNLCLAVSFRSGEGGVSIPTGPRVQRRDQALFRLLAGKVAELTNIPVQESAEYTDFADWMYLELGVPCLRLDPWNLLRVACPDAEVAECNEASMLAVLRWLDRNNGGRGIVPWSEIEHPQLGKVEVGGWDPALSWFNPPPGELLESLLEAESAAVFTLAATLPKLSLGECRDQIVGWAEAEDSEQEEGELLPLRVIEVEVQNEGYLASYLTEELREREEPLIAEIDLPEGAELLLGDSRVERAPLAGIVSVLLRRNLNWPLFSGCSDTQRLVERWLVRGRGEVVVSARHPRGGVVQFVSDGAGTPLLQRSKVLKPSAIIPDFAQLPYVGLASAMLGVAEPVAAGSAPKAPSLPRASFKIPVASKSGALRSSLEPTPPSDLAQALSSLEKEEAAPPVRPLNLAESGSGGEAPKSPPRAAVRGGYKPIALGGIAPKRPSSLEPQPVSALEKSGESKSLGGLHKAAAPRPPAVEEAPAPAAREESPLRKSIARNRVKPSGRVFGQPPPKGNQVLTGSRAAEAEARAAEREERPAPPRRGEVKPHPLLPSKSSRPAPLPQESLPEVATPEDDGLEGPLAPSAPLLLRRNREE